MSIILAAALLATPAAETHNIRIDHRGTPIEVTYSADVAVKRKQIGISPPNRPGSARCVWTATVRVDRSVGRSAPREIEAEEAFSGSRHGDCATNRSAIDKEVAGRGDAVRTRLAAAAERDRHQLRAELDAAGAFALND